MQFVADLTGLEISVSEIPEASAWGAAMAALLHLGKHKSVEGLTLPSRAARGFRPRMPAEQVAKFYNGWPSAVKRVL